MTDLALRQQYRQAVQGDTHAEAQLLVERIRAGTLTQARLRLAAYCGSEAARILESCDCCAPVWAWCDPKYWLSGLSRYAANLDVEEREERFDYCDSCEEPRDVCYHGPHGPYQNRDGIRSVPFDGAEWVLLRAALVSAELAWKNRYTKERRAIICSGKRPKGLAHQGAAREYEAIQAAWVYLRLGTLEAREVWGTTSQPGPRFLPFFPEHTKENIEAIQAAARIVAVRCEGCAACERFVASIIPRNCNGSGRTGGETKVREAICKDLIKWALA